MQPKVGPLFVLAKIIDNFFLPFFGKFVETARYYILYYKVDLSTDLTTLVLATEMNIILILA